MFYQQASAEIKGIVQTVHLLLLSNNQVLKWKLQLLEIHRNIWAPIQIKAQFSHIIQVKSNNKNINNNLMVEDTRQVTISSC